MNSNKLKLILLATSAATAFAGDFYWSSVATQPANWNELSSWKVGGSSQWDPDATVFPSVANSDTVLFRDIDATVTADAGITNAFHILKGTDNASVTFHSSRPPNRHSRAHSPSLVPDRPSRFYPERSICQIGRSMQTLPLLSVSKEAARTS